MPPMAASAAQHDHQRSLERVFPRIMADSGKFTFEFDGQTVEARAGDTVASALYRAGRRIFTRSFKYHRPRGLLCLAGKCPNCLVNVDGAPNVRGCITPARAGIKVRHQNAY